MRALLTGLVLLLMVIGKPGSAAPIEAELGVGLTPAHFPRQSGVDVERMFKIAGEIGKLPVILGRWDDANFGRTVQQMMMLTDKNQLNAVVQIDIFEVGGTRLAPPANVSGRGFNRAVSEAYIRFVGEVAAQRPAYLVAALDTNRLLAAGTDQLAEFARVYKLAYRAAKAVSPETKMLVAFNYEIFRQVRSRGVPFSDIRKLIDLFRPELDALAFSSLPSENFGSPAKIAADYFDGMLELRGREPILLMTGWPSAAGGEAAQAGFVKRLPELVGRLRPAALLWPLLHDLPTGGAVGSLGLYTADGREKEAARPFRAMRGAPAAGPSARSVAMVSSIVPAVETRRHNPADAFSIATSTLSGASPTLMASDPKREINHARISPDGKQFVFTRYNLFNRDGEALEINGYLQTELIVCQVAGEACTVVVPARRGIVAANAYWTPDGQRLLFVSNDTANREPGIAVLDLASRQISMLQTGNDVEFADPHQVGQLMVAPGKEKSAERLSQLFLFDLPTMKRRQLTWPRIPKMTSMDPPLGDHDPKLSPDGRFVAVMRHLDKDDWAIVVVDCATGAERNLSGPRPVDAVPEWSSDGRLLIFWHVDRDDLRRSGLYTMRPDGTERRRVPLPQGYFYTMPAFFPNAGSGPDAGIIYSARPNPRM